MSKPQTRVYYLAGPGYEQIDSDMNDVFAELPSDVRQWLFDLAHTIAALRYRGRRLPRILRELRGSKGGAR